MKSKKGSRSEKMTDLVSLLDSSGCGMICGDSILETVSIFCNLLKVTLLLTINLSTSKFRLPDVVHLCPMNIIYCW